MVRHFDDRHFQSTQVIKGIWTNSTEVLEWGPWQSPGKPSGEESKSPEAEALSCV